MRKTYKTKTFADLLKVCTGPDIVPQVILCKMLTICQVSALRNRLRRIGYNHGFTTLCNAASRKESNMYQTGIFKPQSAMQNVT